MSLRLLWITVLISRISQISLLLHAWLLKLKKSNLKVYNLVLQLANYCVSLPQVILATGISYGAMLTQRFDLPDIELLGGILPGEWYVPRPQYYR